MQTIKINIEQTANGCEFSTGFKSIARIRLSANGYFIAFFGAVHKIPRICDSLAQAVEFLSDAIFNHFDKLGLAVEFNRYN